MKSQNILVTGGTGFIGRSLVEKYRLEGCTVSVLTRKNVVDMDQGGVGAGIKFITGDITLPETIIGVCEGIDTIFHCAGYAHAVNESDIKSSEKHFRTTILGTESLLREAESADVKHIIFLSSVKAMGEGSNSMIDETSDEHPVTPYGKAKLEAEKLIKAWGNKNKRLTSILRLPLVYGRGSKGNIPRMISAIANGRFPPFPKIENKRSMVHVDDVVTAMLLIEEKQNTNCEIFIVTDGQVYSTRLIYEHICRSLGRKIARWTIPVYVLKMGAVFGDVVEWALGKSIGLNSEMLQKLIGSSWYSCGKIQRELGFQPRSTLVSALPEMIHDYKNSEH